MVFFFKILFSPSSQKLEILYLISSIKDRLQFFVGILDARSEGGASLLRTAAILVPDLRFDLAEDVHLDFSVEELFEVGHVDA